MNYALRQFLSTATTIGLCAIPLAAHASPWTVFRDAWTAPVRIPAQVVTDVAKGKGVDPIKTLASVNPVASQIYSVNESTGALQPVVGAAVNAAMLPVHVVGLVKEAHDRSRELKQTIAAADATLAAMEESAKAVQQTAGTADAAIKQAQALMDLARRTYTQAVELHARALAAIGSIADFSTPEGKAALERATLDVNAALKLMADAVNLAKMAEQVLGPQSISTSVTSGAQAAAP